ncbi:DUF2125 domain-containing protein [Phyllobacterium salinisoli]|uniref:DUF2125 domain-containing protein n=1 Tax=Phyllobacterium salinisoli TaxID=1899321 RepID=A0A368JZ41_9HYPH|nr:DUF2125 domain-containing protein [Phyllobacterium salinisoli]RCS22436.1 DUF2125 domain-containing protein [Phyllobacterium salinisoli]
MASSVSSRSNKKAFLLLVAGVLIAVAAYTAGWYYLAEKIEARAKSDLAGLSARGISANCEDLRTTGYPLRIDIVCDSISWRRSNAGISFLAGRIISGSPVYAPRSLTNEIVGPAFIGIPGLVPLELRWERLTTSTQLIRPVPSQISTVAKGLHIAVRTQTTSATPLAEIANLKFDASGFNGPLQTNFSFDGLKLSQMITGDTPVPTLSGSADIQFSDATALLQPRSGPIEERLRGQSGEIKSAILTLPSGGSLSLSGPFSVDADGVIDGTFHVSLINPPALAEAARMAFPDQDRNIATVLFALSAMPKDENGAPTIMVNVRRGKAIAGFIPLGTLPTL